MARPRAKEPAPGLKAVRVRPTQYGTTPALKPCEWCKDVIDGMYHFCTPDGYYFAIWNQSKASKVRVEVHGGDIVHVVFGPVSYCARAGIAVPNCWTVDNGVWVKE